MATEAKNTNYWISSTALYIQLNSMGEPDYIQCSVVSGASVLCYMSDVPGLGYDAGHNYQRWTLAAYPSIFPDSARKYVYIAIPRQSTTDNNQATVVFPGQKIDIYGKTIPSSGTEGVQIGNEAYYYIFTGGIISAVKTDADNTRKREWEQHFECGKLATDEAIASGGEGAWWRYNSVSDTITFLKEILNATFNELSAKVARVTSLFLGGHELKGVADSNGTLETSNDTVVTPQYLGLFGVKHFLAKDKDDTAHGTITWEKVQKFFSGLHVGNPNNENGGSWTPDAEGRSHLITDYLEVRMKAIFEELVINKTSTIGGKEIISPAGGVVAHKVEEVTVTYNNVSQKAYRCYFLAEQEGDAVDNDFAVGDQVRSESFNVRKGTYHKAGNHFYWRLVIGRDEAPVELEGKKYHYIDLSDTDCATASDVPAKGDVLNQCGNRTDVERQNCLIFSAVDTYSPSISLYYGINSYSFANREYVEYGVNKQNNKAFFNVYGDMYVGDRPTKENGYEGSSYIRYDSSTKQMSVKAKISAKSTVDGKELSQYFKKIGELQNQVDGAIETWFYDGVPTLENAPAISWKTDKDKEIHLGDLYYDNKTGKAYRFAKDSNTYKWTLITDTDIAKALSDARMAQETANGKMKVFSVQPTTPYQVGDIWVNATYPSDGSTYKNEVLRCQTNKAAGSQFAIGDWIKASKYTDDTVANAAKKAAEDAQKAAQTAQTDIKNLGKTVTENKKEFDNYVTDGYLEPSEIAAMAQDSKRLEDDFAAAQKSYNEVKNAEVLANTKELTDLTSAFTVLSTAKKELIKYLSDISKRYNETDTNGKAAIVSAVGTKFTNFQSAYSAFYDKLGLANAYITRKIYGDLKQNITDLAGYKYLKDALGQTTDIDGGLVMTTLLALRDGDGNVQSGINGAIDPNRGKKSIATWWGGQMVDKDYNSGNLTPATSLIRFDGSGYLANGAIWWDVSGKVHADPTSFIISEKNLGAYLIFFEPTWKEGSTGTSVADLVSLKPNAPFSKLGVSGDATFEGAISFHGIKLTYDSTNKAIKIDGNLYATGGITAYGAGASTTGGGGGLNGSVKSYSNALKLTSESLSEIASAYSIKALDSRISSLEGGSAMDVSVSGSGNAVTAISKSGTTIIVTKGTTFLTSHQSLASYLTRTDAASLYQPKGNYLTAHQSLDGYVNEVATSGTGNAITSVSKSGKKLTFTKGATFLTSHQSLANYVTINDSRLSDSRYPKFANNTWYLVGDDAYMGDCNVMGMIGVKSANAATPGFALYNNSGTLLGRLYASKGTLVWDGGTIQTTNFSGNASSATTSSMLKTADLKGAKYVPSDTHYMCLGYMDCTGSYDSLTLLVTSAFWGNHHGSQDIITIQQSTNTDDTARIQATVGRLRLGGSTERTFYYYKDNSSFRLYLYVYVTGGNAYGRWNISYLGGNATWVTAYQKNVTKSSSWITIGYSAQVNYASSAGNADTVDGYHVNGSNVAPYGHIPSIENDGVMEVGKYIDFHNDNSGKYDFSTRLQTTGNYGNSINLPSASGTLALTSDNVASATKLQTPRTIWGQSFDGTGNIDGTLTITNSGSGDPHIISTVNKWFHIVSKYKLVLYAGDYNSSQLDAINILPNHNVGIGVNPSYKLHVAGDIYSSDRVIANNSVLSNKLYSSTTPNITTPNKCIEIAGNTIREYHSEANSSPNHSSLILGDTSLSLSANSTIYISTAGGINLISSQEFTIKYRGAKFTVEQNGSGYIWSMDSIKANGNILATGGITAYSSSDIRLKQDLRKLDYLGIIKAMGGTYGFAWKKDNTRSIGWIAQHVLCNPHLKDIVETDEKGYYKINYWSPKLIATAFGAIEQVGDEVSRLKARVVFLESEVQRLSGDKEDCNKKRLDNKNINSLN